MLWSMKYERYGPLSIHLHYERERDLRKSSLFLSHMYTHVCPRSQYFESPPPLSFTPYYIAAAPRIYFSSFFSSAVRPTFFTYLSKSFFFSLLPLLGYWDFFRFEDLCSGSGRAVKARLGNVIEKRGSKKGISLWLWMQVQKGKKNASISFFFLPTLLQKIYGQCCLDFNAVSSSGFKYSWDAVVPTDERKASADHINARSKKIIIWGNLIDVGPKHHIKQDII